MFDGCRHAVGKLIILFLLGPESADRLYPKRSGATNSIELGMAHFHTSFYTIAQQSAHLITSPEYKQ